MTNRLWVISGAVDKKIILRWTSLNRIMFHCHSEAKQRIQKLHVGRDFL